jgi:hypothetical protein
MAEDRTLPGWPKKKLVKEVRRHLSHFGIRPVKVQIWQATWNWAHAIARSYFHLHWPLPSEIGTQYILLLLVEMQQSHLLRLPYRAKEIVPPEVAALLPISHQPGFPAIGGEGSVARVRSGRKQRETKNPSLQQELFHEHRP